MPEGFWVVGCYVHEQPTIRPELRKRIGLPELSDLRFRSPVNRNLNTSTTHAMSFGSWYVPPVSKEKMRDDGEI